MSDKGRKSVQRSASVGKRDIVRQRKEECTKVGFSREERPCQTEEGRETLSDRGRKSVQRLASVGKKDFVRNRKEECTEVGFSREERLCQTEEGRVYKGRLQ